ncbi:hypothetical protein O5478_18235 [Escherichia coli]|nr:hypothetical protein [Escherichia coli]
MGIAFDGDFDRCFCLTKKGSLSRAITLSACWQKHSSKKSGAKIIHDPRLSWNTVDVVTAAGGTPVMSKTGHAFIKENVCARRTPSTVAK